MEKAMVANTGVHCFCSLRVYEAPSGRPSERTTLTHPSAESGTGEEKPAPCMPCVTDLSLSPLHLLHYSYSQFSLSK